LVIIQTLQLRVAIDVDYLERERMGRSDALELRLHHVAQVATHARVQRHLLHSWTLSTAAIARSSCMSAANSSGRSDCGPSHSAFSGLGCTSTMMPSAPAASAARAI